MNTHIRQSVTLTYRGVSATVTDYYEHGWPRRSFAELRAKALRLLRSRIYADKHGLSPQPERLVRSYTVDSRELLIMPEHVLREGP